MTRRCTLLFRVVAALSFVPGAAQAAESAARQGVWASGNERFRQIAPQPCVGLAQYTITSDDWQRSGTRVAADLRFQKPKIPTSSQSTAPPATGTANPSLTIQPAAIERQSTQQTAKRIVEARAAPVELPSCQEPSPPIRAAITVISDAENDRQRADAAVARLKELIEQPEAKEATTKNYEQAVAMQPAEIQPVEAPSVDRPSSGAIRSTVEQLRFVAQRLTGKAKPFRPRGHKDSR